ncbi:hypothetical protein E2320_010866, partial [Naja naja]
MEPQLSWQLSCKWQVLGLFLLFNWVLITGQIRYSVVEESKQGTMVGEVAHDLGLTLADLSSRRLWLGSEESKRYFAINLDSGALMVNEKIDRETLCGASSLCILPVQVVIENPLELFHLEVEILDLNDNSPNFITPWLVLRVAESAARGSRLPLESAHDADVGTNAVSAYQLSPNPHFILDIKNVKDGKLLPELVLDQPLDREKQSEHQLILTAYDGGDPVLSGTSQLTIVVLDNNDNEPTFDLPVYKIHFLENIPVGSLIFQLNATDPDADSNGEIQYSFGIHTSDSIQALFGLDPHTGEIYIQGIVDFEESQFYELHIRARDKGIPQMEGHCVIQIEVEDENDHFPDILLTSLVNPLPENIPLETVVGLFSVRDQDSGVNGKVSLQIPMSLPFKIKSFENHFSLITHERLDRETVSQYTIKLTAQDSGIPPLTRDLTILLNISDINDNAPSFSQHFYNSFLKENNPPGSLLCTVSASDPDEGDNSRLTYSVAGNQVQDALISSFIYINPDNGNIYAQHSFDYETLQVLQILVIVQDAGTPILSSSVTVYLFILDQNDNAPVVLYPVTGQQLSALQRIPLSAPVGYVITKVTAVDADSGHNAWLSYSLLPQSTNATLFQVVPYTGEIWTVRSFQETDLLAQKILVLVKDHGKPPLSTTVTILVSLEEKASEESSQSHKLLNHPKEKSDLTLYLIIALVVVSIVSLITLIVLSAKCFWKRKCKDSSNTMNNAPIRDLFKYSSPKLQLNSNGTLEYMEVTLRPADSHNQSHKSRHSSESDRIDFTFMRPVYSQPSTLTRNVDPFLSHINTLNHPKQIRYSVPEELTRGAFVGNLAKDLGMDVTKLAAANLQVLSDSDFQYFSVNVNTGIIIINDRIDREQLCGQNLRCFLHLKLAIENPVEFYRIEVEILDINDNAPEFSSSTIVLQIYELAALGARFPIPHAQDPDIGTNTLQTYHLSINENFSLNVKARTDGTKFPELVLEKALDREHVAIHNLILTAEDGGTFPRSSTVQIAVHVLDANDNHPVFDKPTYNVRLVENSPPGTLVIKLNATDFDEGSNGQVRYSLSSHNSEALCRIFAIDNITGEIRVQGTLDFEEASIYEIEVEAKDMGSPTMEQHCSVIVEVTDVNDNVPEVILTSFSSSMSEDAPPGTVVAVIHVKDRDSGDQGKVQCDLSKNLPFKLRKDFEHQYSLLIGEQLDRENSPQYNITICAFDLGNPSLLQQASFSITLADVNDNPPQFDRSFYEVIIEENNPVGVILLKVSATDADKDQNSQLSYIVLSSPGQELIEDLTSFISINPTNGEVFAESSFDYECNNHFQFQVEACDGGSPSLCNRVMVHIYLLDQNDNAPKVQFPFAGKDSVVQFRIPRSTMAKALITKIIAVDLDSGQNAWLSYHLKQATDLSLFSISLHSGEMRTLRIIQDLDNPTQELVIVVKDSGELSMSTSVTVIIFLEESTSEVFLGLSARSVESERPPTLTLYLIICLAAISTIMLIALVALGARCLHCDALATSTIFGCCGSKASGLENVPDHMTGHYHYQLSPGDAMIGVQVATSGPPVRGYRSCFSPVSDISEFVFMKPNLTLRAASCSNLTEASFFHKIHYSIPEDQDPGSYVGNIAKDLGVDVRTLRARRLQLVSEGMRQYFQVNLADGMLLVNERLDREMLCSSSPRCSFPFQLVLENPLQLNRVEVEILDVNDNAPRFPKDTVSLEITEVANLGTRLRLEVAEDQDTGSNSIATYELSPNEHFALSINIRGDGVKIPEIVLEKLLDREKAATHHLILTALDSGNPVQSGTVQVTVHVLDANDNPPVCEPPVSKVYLEENIQVGTIVTKLNVTDLDEGPNGEVEYFFKSSSSVQLKLLDVFSLDSQTGEIRTKVLLDYEEANAYEIAIYIKDKGSPAMEGHCNIRVELVDVNDNSPEIMMTTLSSSVQEDAPIGTVIALIQAKDNDSEENGQVCLEIPRHVPFKLVSSFKGHYSLVTNGPLDREKTAGYSITIKATDSGIPQKSTEKNILIQVSDINDNAPTFSIPSYTAHVEENTSPGTLVFSVSACDPDVGVNSKLSYSIVDTGNHGLPISTYFHINQENGSIYTSRVLDYEQEKVFQVSVEVKDSGFPPLSSTSTLHLFIVDQNDNAPVIVHPEVPKGSAFHQSLLIPVEPGYLVTKVVAVDADSGHNAWVSYHLLHETNEVNAFKVEDHSGEIRVTRTLREPGVSHRLVVEVKDNGVPSLSASMILIISSEDNAAQDFTKSLDLLPKSPARAQNLTLYLIISLVAISLVSCVMMIIVGARCFKSGFCIPNWIISHWCSRRTDRKSTINISGYPNPEGFIRYLEVSGTGAQNYKSCFSPMSEQGDFFFVKPFSHSTTAESILAFEHTGSALQNPSD